MVSLCIKFVLIISIFIDIFTEIAQPKDSVPSKQGFFIGYSPMLNLKGDTGATISIVEFRKLILNIIKLKPGKQMTMNELITTEQPDTISNHASVKVSLSSHREYLFQQTIHKDKEILPAHKGPAPPSMAPNYQAPNLFSSNFGIFNGIQRIVAWPLKIFSI